MRWWQWWWVDICWDYQHHKKLIGQMQHSLDDIAAEKSDREFKDKIRAQCPGFRHLNHYYEWSA